MSRVVHLCTLLVARLTGSCDWVLVGACLAVSLNTSRLRGSRFRVNLSLSGRGLVAEGHVHFSRST